MRTQVYVGLPIADMTEAFKRFSESFPQICKAISELAFSLESIREWQQKRKHKRNRHLRINRTLPRNYRARSKR